MTTYLDELKEISKALGDGGLMHSGVIHYIQSKACAIGMDDFVLKAAIYEILNAVPDVFPKDLPEMVSNDPDIEPTMRMLEFLDEINEKLLVPVSGFDVLLVISYAKQYESEAMNKLHGEGGTA